VKVSLLFLSLLVSPAAAQRPTAEVARVATSFWPLDAATGTIRFTGPTAQPLASGLRQAEHLRDWLTRTCPVWNELQTQADSSQLYRGQLPGTHAGVVLTFVMRLTRPVGRWQYQLLAFQVGAPTGEGLMQYVPLWQVLDNIDYRPDVASFQQQLQGALPSL
jgi:hypothetical protein